MPALVRRNFAELSIELDQRIGGGSRRRILSALESMSPMHLTSTRLRVAPLAGGGSNENYLVHDEETPRYVLRVAASLENNDRFGIDRWAGILLHHAAQKIGISPPLHGVVLPRGDTLTEFIVGEEITPASVGEGERIEECIRLLRAAHTGLEGTHHRFSAYRDIIAYSVLAEEEGLRTPDDLDELVEHAARIERAFDALSIPSIVCHNDPTTANFFRSEGRLWLLDWEYAGLGNPYFDLAGFVSDAGLDRDGVGRLLQAYFGRVRDCDRARIEAQRFMADMREATWAMAAQPVLATTGYDHSGRSDDFFRRARSSRAAFPVAELPALMADSAEDIELFAQALSRS